MDAGSVDAVITDPPYGIHYASSWTTRPDGTPRQTGASFGDDVYNPLWMAEIARVMATDSLAYVFVRWDVAHVFRRDAEAAGLVCVQRMIWDKRHWGMGDLRYYGSQTEDALLFRKGAPMLRSEKRMGNLWACPSKAYFPEGVYDHPAQKPLDVIIEWVQHASDPGDLVFDPFMGSGTTGVAAIQEGRRFIGCELDETYFEIARKRIADAQARPRLFEYETTAETLIKQSSLLED
jgi:site-specific DNA-methyltransferase (adenine-specific)